MAKKKKKGLLTDDKARIGYQEGKEVKVVPTREELVKKQRKEAEEFRKQLIQEARDANFERDIPYIEEYTFEELLEKMKNREEMIAELEKKRKEKEIDEKGRKAYEDTINRKYFAEGGDVDAQMEELLPTEDEDMKGVAISISPVTATKEDIEQLETADTDETVSDEQMEDDHLDFIIDQSLDQEEEMYLMETLQADSRLSMIFDKVMDTASEFSGSGPVEGLGTEVSDSIPARLSDGEFVMTTKATDEIGADNLQRMMEDAEEASDNRQKVAMGGELEKKVDEFGKPMDQDLADEEIKRSMLSVNPRLQ
tara:strand:+ start:121 stop:1050 length:930 start_codon:yes stop_codon:yes gene_type:complete